MKRFLLYISMILAAATVSSCDWFELDNQEGYNASVHGTFKDSKTGQPVQSEIYGVTTTITWGSWSWEQTDVLGYFNVYEYGWVDNPTAQKWNMKNNGTYTNKLVFAGDYRAEGKDNNFYPLNQEFKLNKGDNTVDFTVTPYVRIKDEKITYDSATKKIKATFKVEPGDERTNYVGEVRLCCYFDQFVGSNFNNCKQDAGAYKTDVTDLCDGTQEITLEIDTQAEANIEEFKYARPHYVRVASFGGPATVAEWFGMKFYNLTQNTNKRYNFSPVYKISADYKTITLVDNWDAK
ncbi:MAG: DUF3823 domain-containing protein [Bacteroidales bacterium]|nr:DUF3823 domain-containing protein [Bacteroidales bacterium]